MTSERTNVAERPRQPLGRCEGSQGLSRAFRLLHPEEGLKGGWVLEPSPRAFGPMMVRAYEGNSTTPK